MTDKLASGSEPGIGIFGGSFDPVHLGHLWIAEAALGQLPVEHIRWIPAATSPLKPNGPTATDSQRLQMLRLALAGHEGHRIDPWELEQEKISYTVETLQYLKSRFPERLLYLIVGSDSLASFDRWESPSRILELCTLSVVERGGESPPNYEILSDFATPEKIEECRSYQVDMPLIEVSSSHLRDQVKEDRSIRFQVPHAVDAYIRHKKLFR